MKRIITFLLIMSFVLCFASCKVAPDEVITGDVKQSGDAVSADEENITSDTEVSKSDSDPDFMVEVGDGDKNEIGIDELVTKLGFVISVGGDYNEDAARLCEAVISADTGVFAEFTGGKPEYYEFLTNVKISSYTLYPVAFTEEKLLQMNENYIYPTASDNYLVEFEVEESSTDEFRKGRNIYCFGLEMDPVSGNLLAFFVPEEMAEKSITTIYDTDYVMYFIEEFSALYPIQSVLYDGRNYADSFDFSKHSHLITHLMARSGVYGDPPYTLDEVNEFIQTVFDGNAGLDPTIPLEYTSWTSAGSVYQSTDDKRIYGCSWAHGGTSVECDIVNVEKDGKSADYTVQIYAEFSKVAKAYTLVFHFDDVEAELPVLTMVERIDNTQRPAALSSI